MPMSAPLFSAILRHAVRTKSSFATPVSSRCCITVSRMRSTISARPIVARIVSELANTRTGIDIHPGATIGRGVFIDHGTGVVIGETAIIGDRVQIYQHVTLGARSPLGVTDMSVRERLARHPIVEDDVVIYAGATILGRVTIGHGTTIGGNVWLLEDVPPGSVVAQPTALILQSDAATRLHETLRGRSA